MMKTVVRFFRQRAVKGFLKRKKPCVLPDISKYPAMAVLLDKDRFNRRAEIEKTLTRVFVMKNYVFIVVNGKERKKILGKTVDKTA